MKTKILIITFMLCASMNFAQENDIPSGNIQLPKNEIAFSVGDNMIRTLGEDGRILGFGSYTLSYHHRFKNWLWLGAYLNAFPIKDRAFSPDMIETGVSLAPSVRFSYLNKPNLTLYSGFSFGLQAVLRTSTSIEPNVFFHTTFLGFSVGKKFFVGGEAGFGHKGILSVNAGYRFNGREQRRVNEVNIRKKSEISGEYSRQTFVTGGAALGVPSSFRLQVGTVKKNLGFYAAWTTNFQNYKPHGDYGENPEDYLWSGREFYNRWVIHAGPVICLNPDFMLYFGTGFGKIIQLRETVSGHKMYSHHNNLIDFTIETDLGLMYTVGQRFVISAGFSAGTAFLNWYPAGNIGLGVMF